MIPSPSLKRLRVGLVALAVFFILSVLGYCLAGRDLVDAVYMVVITLSTVGYGETSRMSPGEQLLTVVVIVFGVSTGFYIVGGFVQMMAEGEINRALGIRRVSKEIDRLSGHVVLCGFGRVGGALAGELHRRKQPFVVLENDPQRLDEAATEGYLALDQDATEEEALLAAGVKRAKTVVTSLRRDAENVFITLTARNLNPKLQIIARAESRSTEKKLIQAGADRVVLPSTSGGLRMAAMITRPTTVELVELAAGRHAAEVEIDELTIPPESSLVGRTVRDSQTRARHGLLIVGVRHADGDLIFNPDADTEFLAHDSVMVMGRSDDIERFCSAYGI